MLNVIPNFIVSSNYTVFYKIFCPSYQDAILNCSAELPYIASEAFKSKWVARFFYNLLKIFNSLMNSRKSFFIFDYLDTADINWRISISHLQLAELLMKIKRGLTRIAGFTTRFIEQFFYFSPFFLAETLRILNPYTKGNPLVCFKWNIYEGFKYTLFKYYRNVYCHLYHLASLNISQWLGLVKGSMGDVPRPFDTRCKLYAKGRGVAEMMTLSPLVDSLKAGFLSGWNLPFRVSFRPRDSWLQPWWASFSTVGVFPGVNSINDNTGTLKVKADTVFSDSESMGGRGQINQRFGEGQWVFVPDVQLNLFNNSFLQLDRKFFEFSFSTGSEFNLLEHSLNYDNPNSCFIFSKGTNPSFLASSMPFFNLNANLGLMGRRASMASISQPNGLWNTYSLAETFSSNLVSAVQSRSHNEDVSKIKYLGEPLLSTTTPALKSFEIRPDFLNSSGMAANFSNASNLTVCFICNLTNDFDFIVLPPVYVLKEAYHILENLSSNAYADVTMPGIFTHNTYINGDIEAVTGAISGTINTSGNIKLTGRIRQGIMGDVAEMMALSPLVLDSAKYTSSVVEKNILPRSNDIVGNASNILRADTGSLSGGLSREVLDCVLPPKVARLALTLLALILCQSRITLRGRDTDICDEAVGIKTA